MRIDQLTFTRFIAAVCIVIFHFAKEVELFYNNYTGFIFNQANLGVSYFFVLSGFVMMVAYGDKNQINFFDYIKNRVARIFPVYYLAIFLVLSIMLFSNFSWSDLFLNLTLLQSWFPGKALTINYPGWSLSVELFFYLLFPFLFNVLYKKVNLKILFFISLVFWFLSQLYYNYEMKNDILKNSYLNYFPILHLNQFIIGNLFGLYFTSYKSHEKSNNILKIITLFFVFILILKYNKSVFLHNGAISLVFAYMILLIATSNDSITNFFSRKLFILLGEVSFGIYILQVPIWHLFSDYRLNKYFGLDKSNDFSLSFFVRLFLLIAFSTIIYFVFEIPLRNKIKSVNFKK